MGKIGVHMSVTLATTTTTNPDDQWAIVARSKYKGVWSGFEIYRFVDHYPLAQSLAKSMMLDSEVEAFVRPGWACGSGTDEYPPLHSEKVDPPSIRQAFG